MCIFMVKAKNNNMKIMVSGALLTPHGNLVAMATKLNRRHTEKCPDKFVLDCSAINKLCCKKLYLNLFIET